MACWSAENATKAYLSTLKLGQNAKEPAVAEFISALAAGNNAQVMVVACAGLADSTTLLLALVVAAHQTGGHVICIVHDIEELNASKNVLGIASPQVQFMVREEAQELLLNQAADFVLIDCNLVNHEEILKSVQVGCGKQNGTMVVGLNAFGCKGSWRSCGSKTQLLPIGEGLLVTRFGASATSPKYGFGLSKIRSRWVVKVDKCTGEEHVYMIRHPQGKVVQA